LVTIEDGLMLGIARRLVGGKPFLQMTLLGLELVLASGFVGAQESQLIPTMACSLGNLKDVARVGQFVFKSYKSDESGSCLQVLRGRKVIFRRTLDSPDGYTLGQSADPNYAIPGITNGTDVTGRRRPDMIVSYFTGGAHCCMYHYVFELEPAFKLLATLYDADDDLSHFADLGKDGHYYYLTADWTFAYWWLSFAGSPSHSVVLRYVDDAIGGSFHLAMDKMLTPAPTPKEWEKARGDVRGELRLEEENMVNELPNVLWQEVLDLIYTGHSDLAWRFLDEVGPRAQQDPYPDLEAFCSTLKASPYWLDLAPTLKDAPPACINAKPRKGKR
jgi:hypothetical protein